MSLSAAELAEFKIEAFELLEAAESSLLAVSDAPGSFRQTFDSTFRAFHSLKGAAGMVELGQIQAHTHELETILMNFKESSSIPKEYVSLFLRGIDATRLMLEGADVPFDYAVTAPGAALPPPVASAASPVPSAPVAGPASAQLPPEVLAEFVDECQELVERIGGNLQLQERKGAERPSNIDELYRDIHSVKGAAFLFSFNQMGELAHAMETSLEGFRDGVRAPPAPLIDLLLAALDRMQDALNGIKTQGCEPTSAANAVPELAERLIAAASAEAGAEAPRPTVASVVASDATATSTARTERGPVIAPVVSAPSLTLAPPVAGTAPSETKSPAAAPAKDHEQAMSIRVPVPLLDSLMTLMGEMVLVRNQVLQFSGNSDDLAYLSMSKRLNVVTTEIQAEMMKTRMQPIGNVLSKFSRVVRDVSHELHKEISLEITGAETELDKSLLEAIKDPLTHIVRNSCDHGIETPETRLAAGKPAGGTIAIKSYHEGGQVVVEIADDGKGLNKEVLLAKAVEKGIVTAIAATKLGDKEIFNLIFAPGFSTAAKVTNLSGRGVGMDVVRTNIEKIGGTVDLASVPGRGTTIKLKIPLTLAIVPALIVRCGTGLFAIPQVKLEELLRVDHSGAGQRIELMHGTPILRLRGNILSLIDLSCLLGYKKTGAANYGEGIVNIAVLSSEQGSFGVIIDEVQDTADIVVKPLNRLLKSLQIYSGATILGDGSVALILDVPGISKVARLGGEKGEGARGSAVAEAADRRSSDEKHYLLVRLAAKARHAIPLELVSRLEEFDAGKIETSGFQRMIRYRDIILPLISANEAIGYAADAASRESIPVVVIKLAGVSYGIEVNEILDTFASRGAVEPSARPQVGLRGNLNEREELIVVLDSEALVARALGTLLTLAPSPVLGNGRAA